MTLLLFKSNDETLQNVMMEEDRARRAPPSILTALLFTLPKQGFSLNYQTEIDTSEPGNSLTRIFTSGFGTGSEY